MFPHAQHHRASMAITITLSTCLLMGTTHAVTVPVGQHPQPNPYYGEALFYSFQQDYFTALTHLMAARKKGLLGDQATAASLLTRWLRLTSGVSEKPGQDFPDLLTKQIPTANRDEIWFDLGNTFFLRGDYPTAENALRHNHGQLTTAHRKEYPLLLAQILMAQHKYRQASNILQAARARQDKQPFARYNLGIALYQAGQHTAGITQLESLGQQTTTDPVIQILRDKTNVTLGNLYLKNNQPKAAKTAFKRVQLEGPYARQALLGLGWAEWDATKPRAAQLAWSELLASGSHSDPLTQEALLGIAQSLWKLQSFTLATKKFREAINIYERQLALLDQAITNAGKGIWQARLLPRIGQAPILQQAWQIISASPLNHYLGPLLQEHPFQATLQSYQQLNELADRISTGAQRLSALETLSATDSTTPLRQLSQRRQQLQRGIDQSRQQHAHLLQRLIIGELQRQRRQLGQRLIDARLFLARLLDELAEDQAGAGRQ